MCKISTNMTLHFPYQMFLMHSISFKKYFITLAAQLFYKIFLHITLYELFYKIIPHARNYSRQKTLPFQASVRRACALNPFLHSGSDVRHSLCNNCNHKSLTPAT